MATQRLLLVLAGLALAVPAWAVPLQVVQQGRLLGTDGQPLDGAHDLSFALYDAAAAGTEHWSETHNAVFDAGYYSVTLGTVSPLDDLLFSGGSLWLELSVDGVALQPRQQITSVPWALRASSAEHLDGGVVDAAEVRVGGVPVIDSTGQWVGPSPSVAWSAVTGVPADLADGDADNDTLASLGCFPGEIVRVDPSTGLWSCVVATLSVDSDLDGVIDSADCEPNDASISPIAVEVCDGVDNNCNGVADESTAVDAPTWYADLDGDGVAGSVVFVTACSQPVQFFATGGDCDDTDVSNHPGVLEVCDGFDNDCNGLADYVTTVGDGGGEIDSDGDGAIDCADCADGDATVFPNAIESCDGLDQDCDGFVDENFDGDSDSVTSCGADGIAGTPDDDCDDGDPNVSPLAPELCDGIDNNCDGLPDPAGSGLSCAADSCKQILDDGFSVGDGTYWINPDGSGAFAVYCDMTLSGGGWTMVLMVAGNDIDTFRYDSSYWTTGVLLNETVTDPASDENMKNQAYHNLAFNEIRLDMATLGNSHLVNQSSSSSAALFTGSHIDPGFSRADYLNWIPEANSEWDNQPNCNRKGFQVSVSQGNCRYGINMNNEDQCNSNDSAVGFGCHTNGFYVNRTTACGGHRWTPDVAYLYRGWIFVR